jgi:hypothetical protein
MSLEIMINPRTQEIHIFEKGAERSICNQVSREGLEVVRIVHIDADTLSGIEPCQATSVFAALKALGLNTCGNCAKVLYK